MATIWCDYKPTTIMTPPLIYVACPYSSDDLYIRELRYETATEYSAHLVSSGFHVFSPITHSHPIAQHADLPTDWEYWKSFDERMLSVCDIVHVLRMPGYDTSTGVQAEIKIARNLGKPVEFIQNPYRI